MTTVTYVLLRTKVCTSLRKIESTFLYLCLSLLPWTAGTNHHSSAQVRQWHFLSWHPADNLTTYFIDGNSFKSLPVSLLHSCPSQSHRHLSASTYILIAIKPSLQWKALFSLFDPGSRPLSPPWWSWVISNLPFSSVCFSLLLHFSLI